MGPSGLFVSVFVFVFLSMLFSLMETAVVSTPEEKIFKMAQGGNSRAKMALKVINNKDKIVGVTLLCDNAVNIAASSLSAVFFAELFGEKDEIGILLSTIIMTILVFIFGEVLPKMISLKQPTKTTLLFSPFLLLLWKILYPIIWSVNEFIGQIVNIFHIKDETANEQADDNILETVEMYHQKGMIKNDEKDMLSGILQLDDIDVKDIMVHRSDMFAIDINDKYENIIEKILSTNFTKIPFYDTTDDKIIGFLKVNQLLKEIIKNKDIQQFDIRKLLQKPWFLPENSSIKKHLQEFKNRGNIIAFVVDEYGGIMGMLTLEDVLEEIVGDINSDEIKNNLFIQNQDGSFVVNADMNLNEANEKICSNFVDNNASTIGGFLLNKIEKIPSKGEKFIIGNYCFTILESTNTSIEKIGIAILKS